ncbi:protein phosphatase 1G [Sander lucioperca]|uniref:Protein phosphatase 1G n=1 Tax=Sander lucioperca TaxID=283035 RepID=A0A8C9XMQ0_SANLU|nr:protein phosphatase 1G [Sander lucioperca]XP_035855285.1 protein phosphatase 1G [Sander lucioperca]
MGAYLSQPNTTKTSSDGGNSNMSYGFSAMQGWRVSMEDAHNCIPEFDEETAMFSVYDGHGGEEVALYCSKYLPDIIKEQKTYKDGKLQKALEDAFLAIDRRMIKEDVIKELIQIAGRPTEEPPAEKVAEEDDLDTEEASLLHEEATMTIEELLVRYGQNLNAVKHAAALSAAAKKASCSHPEASGDKGEDGEGQKEGVNGEAEEASNGKVKEGEGAACGSKLRACRRTGGGEGSGAAADCGESGSSNGEEKAGKAEGDAGPSCSSLSSNAAGDSKSRFFDDSEESEEGEEEEGSDEEDGSEEEEGDSSEMEEEEDTEEGEEDSEDEEEEEMCLPGMDGKEEPGSDSGTTAVVALIRGKQLIVANAGDSRCVVSERGKAVDMSYDHKPEDELELARIKNAGGKVTMDGRVNGGLNLSRAIGDHFYKRNKALPPEEQMISAMPDVKVLTLNGDHDFMVIACDGIWNVLSSQEVVDFISERINKPDENGKVRVLSCIVEELLDHCLAPDTSGDGTGCDNMTCIIVTLRPHPSHQPDDTKKRKHPEEAEGAKPEENGNDSKKAKSD